MYKFVHAARQNVHVTLSLNHHMGVVPGKFYILKLLSGLISLSALYMRLNGITARHEFSFQQQKIPERPENA